MVWTPNLPDPQAYLNLLLDTRRIGGTNVAGFTSATYDNSLRRVASVPKTRERQLAYGDLDIPGSRAQRSAARSRQRPQRADVRTDRVDGACIVLRPALDLTAVCLK